jgi:hypothetical protein
VLLGSTSLRVNGVEVPVPVNGWQTFPAARSRAWQPAGAMPLHYQFIDKETLKPDRAYQVSASLGAGEPAQARFTTLPEQLGDETKPLRVLLSSCYFTGNKRSRLAATLFAQLERNGLRPHLRIWAGDQVYLDAPWYEFAIKSHSISELERLHSASYARTWFADQGLKTVLPQGANVFCTDDHELWNNAPHASVVARDTSDPTKRTAWRAIARALAQTFQGDTANGQRFRVPPLDFFVLDARVNRSEERLFSDTQWQQLRAWAAEPQGLGVLVLGQPIFERASKRRGDLGDYRLADYERDYSELMELLGRATRSTTVLTGDVHFSRVTSSSFPASATSRNERRVTELISSPLALVAGGQLLSMFGDWTAAPAKASLPARHSFSGTTMHTDDSLHSAAEGAMLLEFYRRGQRVFCTVSQWRLNDLEASRPSFRQEYFLGISQ